MRVFLFVLFAALCGSWLPSPSRADSIEITIYDDGRSCPGNCDAHVVFNRSLNGTEYASSPESARSDPEPCTRGEMCRICFSTDDKDCMDVRYRGSGPPAGKFDFTPSFFAEHCKRKGLPPSLDSHCSSMAAAVRRSGYDKRINCFDDPQHEKCKETMQEAQAAFKADLPKWENCQAMGQAAFNAKQTSDSERRIYDCAYSKLSLGGPNSNGTRWKILLPASCRPGTYVGRDGLDCCNADRSMAAALHPECSSFFPKP
ncbi:hypothetical protein ACFORG_12745 [Lutimaribacter marinistellae]|uniref:Secreted protein n=1 Tax=Lutimaribacter marinistellae TaxID=1820329 RepID=A0ABV7TIR9_9RHOB